MTIIAADFTDTTLTGSVTILSNAATFTRTLSSDFAAEGTENFFINLLSAPGSSEVLAYSTTVTVSDSSTAATLYAIATTTPSVEEGDSVTFTVTTTNFGSGTLYWNTSDTAAVTGRFTDRILAGGVTITDNSGTIVRTLSENFITDGTTQFQINILSYDGYILAISNTVTVDDTSREATATQILNDWYTNRSHYLRWNNAATPTTSSTWQGDTLSINHPINRGYGVWSTMFNFDAGSLTQMSSVSTVVIYTICEYPAFTNARIYDQSGATLSIVSQTITAYAGLGLQINTVHVAAEHRQIASVMETHNRNNSDLGNWTGCFIMPGTWQVVNNAAVIDAPNLTVPDVAQYWQKIIPMGRLAMLFAGGNVDQEIAIYNNGPLDSIPATGGYTGYWYNNSVSQIIPNLTSGAIQPKWMTATWVPEYQTSSGDEGGSLITVPAHYEFGDFSLAWSLYNPYYLEFAKV